MNSYIFSSELVNWSGVAQSTRYTICEKRKGFFFWGTSENVMPEIMWSHESQESQLLCVVCSLQELPSYLCKLGVTFQRGTFALNASRWSAKDDGVYVFNSSRPRGFVVLGLNQSFCAFLCRVFLRGGRGHAHPPPQRGFRGISAHSCQHRYQSQQWHAHQKGALRSLRPVRGIKQSPPNIILIITIIPCRFLSWLLSMIESIWPSGAIQATRL